MLNIFRLAKVYYFRKVTIKLYIYFNIKYKFINQIILNKNGNKILLGKLFEFSYNNLIICKHIIYIYIYIYTYTTYNIYVIIFFNL